MEPKEYVEWLNKQRDRNDGLGYIVRKFLVDKDIKSWHGFKRYMEKHGATEDEMRVCEKSWVEYTTNRKWSNENERSI
jgi:hypothetical protein